MLEGTPFGRYRLLELLGRGGMGEVWRAYDAATNRIMAIKLLPSHLGHDDTFAQRFRREAEASAGLNSPHVPSAAGEIRSDTPNDLLQAVANLCLSAHDQRSEHVHLMVDLLIDGLRYGASALASSVLTGGATRVRRADDRLRVPRCAGVDVGAVYPRREAPDLHLSDTRAGNRNIGPELQPIKSAMPPSAERLTPSRGSCCP
jgi:hypothetical protein